MKRGSAWPWAAAGLVAGVVVGPGAPAWAQDSKVLAGYWEGKGAIWDRPLDDAVRKLTRRSETTFWFACDKQLRCRGEATTTYAADLQAVKWSIPLPSGAIEAAVAGSSEKTTLTYPIEGTIAEQGVDELRTGGADLGGLGATPSRCLHEEVDFVGRQVRRQRATLSRTGRAMGGHQGVLVEELDLAEGGPDPEALADEAMGGGVVGAGEDDVAVGVEFGALPLDQLPGGQGQGPERRALELIENLQRAPLGRAVYAPAGGLHAPAQEMAIALADVAEGAAGKRVALDVVDPALLDLAFVLGRPRATGRDEEAVVLGAVAVGALHLGIVEGGVDDGRPQIIQDDAPGDAAEEFEGGPMQAQPGRDRLVEDQLGVLMAAARQRHHENPGAAGPPPLGIQELAGEAEVDLRLLSGLDLDPEGGRGRGRSDAAEEAFHRGIAAGKPVLLDQELPNGLPLDAARVQGEHALAQGLDQRLLVGRPLARRPLQQRGQGPRVRHRPAVEHAVPGGPEPIVRHRVAADAEVAGDAPVGLAQVQPSQDLADIGHRTPPSRHSSPPRAGVLRRGFPVVGRTRKESGHAPPGGSIWPPLGGSAWATLPGSGWATPGGSASPTPVAQYGATADKGHAGGDAEADPQGEVALERAEGVGALSLHE